MRIWVMSFVFEGVRYFEIYWGYSNKHQSKNHLYRKYWTMLLFPQQIQMTHRLNFMHINTTGFLR